MKQNEKNKFFVIMLVTALIAMLLSCPMGVYATEADGTAANVGVAAAPDENITDDSQMDIAVNETGVIDDGVVYQTYSEGEALEESAEAEEKEVFEGNAIGKWLDKTFYSFDYAIFTFFGNLHNDILTTFFNLYTHLGDSEFAIPMLVLGLVLCIPKKTRKYGLALFLAIVIGTVLTNLALKNICGRVRPYVTLSNNPEFMKWYTEAGSNIEGDNSFPSGHTTCAFEIATALFLAVKNKKVKWIFPVYAILILCSRIYLMVHYPTDVCAGVVVGIVSGVIGYVIAVKLNEKIGSKKLKA